MSKSTCLQCGSTISGHSNKKYCSNACRTKAKELRMGRPCYICGEKVRQSHTTTKGKPAHNVCRSGVNGGHGMTGYRRGCRCDECRSAVADAMREYNAKRKMRDGVSATARWKRERKGYSDELLACALCGGRLYRVPADGKRGYHKDCRQKVPTWLVKGLPGPRQRRVRAKLEKAAAGRPSTGRVFTQGACNWCGEVFMSSGGSFFCSRDCRLAQRRHNSGGLSFTISPVERQAIYERDGWVCQLCDRPVDPNLGHRELWAASLDHVVPQSLMLVPDHSAQNLRLSHRLCNSYRRDTEISAEEMRALTEERWALVQEAV